MGTKTNDYLVLKRDLDHIVGMESPRSFNHFLFLAIMSADESNMNILKDSYPDHVHIFRSYKNPSYFLKEK